MYELSDCSAFNFSVHPVNEFNFFLPTCYTVMINAHYYLGVPLFRQMGSIV